MESRETKKIVFLSDLHNRMYGKEMNACWKASKPTSGSDSDRGDMLVRKDGNSYDRTVRFLEKLPAICPVYCANGNHEQKLKELPDKYEQSYEEYKKALTACGIYMLENASETVRLDEAPVRISGLEIPLGAYARFGKKDLPLKEITDRIGEHGDDYQILLAHHPGYIAKEYLAYGADLILAGIITGVWYNSRGSVESFRRILHCFQKYSGEFTGRRTDSSCKPRTWDAFGAVKTVELADELIVLRELSGNKKDKDLSNFQMSCIIIKL